GISYPYTQYENVTYVGGNYSLSFNLKDEQDGWQLYQSTWEDLANKTNASFFTIDFSALRSGNKAFIDDIILMKRNVVTGIKTQVDIKNADLSRTKSARDSILPANWYFAQYYSDETSTIPGT
ncbi:MAG: hypothetical protein OMM_14328, partial [Candidatus Magnetoglobus multicellularis str. Araruama]